jgi:hypothetical protein
MLFVKKLKKQQPEFSDDSLRARRALLRITAHPNPADLSLPP